MGAQMKKPDAWRGIMCACWVQACDMLDYEELEDWRNDSREIAEQVYAMNRGWA